MFEFINNKKGLTLVELLVSFTILGLVFTAILSFMSTGQKGYKKGVERHEVQSTLRIASDFMSKEIRYATELKIKDSVTEITDVLEDTKIIEYKKFGDVEYRYLYVNEQGEFIYKYNGGIQVIGDKVFVGLDVKDIELEEDPTVQYINFELLGQGRSNTYELSTTVQLLNTVGNAIPGAEPLHNFWSDFVEEMNEDDALKKYITTTYNINNEEVRIILNSSQLSNKDGWHVLKELEGRYFPPSANLNNYKLVIDIQSQGGKGFGIYFNGTEDSGYMFLLEEDKKITVRNVIGGMYLDSVGVDSAYEPRFIGASNNNQFSNTRRFLVELSIKQSDDKVKVEVTLKSSDGVVYDVMKFGDFGSYKPPNTQGNKTFMGENIVKKEGNYVGFRVFDNNTWIRNIEIKANN